MKPSVTTNAKERLEIRNAEEKDTQAIMNLINLAFKIVEGFFVASARIQLAEVLDLLSSGNFLLAERQGDLVGCVYVEPRGERSYLGLLSVDPLSQQFGVGSLLMAAAEKYCAEQGSRFMDIKIVNLRKELPAFYQKRGYVETGTSSFPEDVETLLPVHFIDMTKALDHS